MSTTLPSVHVMHTPGSPRLLGPLATSDSPAIEHATAIVAAYVSHNAVSPDRLPELIASVHGAVSDLFSPKPAGPAEPMEKPEPAVSVKKSITADYLICLDDGLRFKSLKRHLKTLGMTPEQYREKWGLPASYPMVAPAYSDLRSKLAKDSGLGTKG